MSPFEKKEQGDKEKISADVCFISHTATLSSMGGWKSKSFTFSASVIGIGKEEKLKLNAEQANQQCLPQKGSWAQMYPFIFISLGNTQEAHHTCWVTLKF